MSFVRTEGRPDRVYVVRSDGSEVSWSFPTYGDRLPHDLVHFVVEAAAGLRAGFWGRVDAGLDVARINADASRRGGAEKYAAFGADLRELMLAEALAGADWSDAVEPAERARAIDAACEALGVASRAPDAALDARIRAALGALGARWRTLVPKGAIDLDLDVSDPRRSFDAITR